MVQILQLHKLLSCAGKGELVMHKVFYATILNVNGATGIESEVGFTVHKNMPAGTHISALKTVVTLINLSLQRT